MNYVETICLAIVKEETNVSMCIRHFDNDIKLIL